MASYEQAPDFTVIKDTREQEGYYFSKYSTCSGMVERKLDTGDYSIEGMEEIICIERKGCVEELAINLGQKKHPFMNEISRMKEFPHKFIILEFSLDDLVNFPENTRIPEKQKSKLKISGKYMLKCLMEFQLHDNIHIIFCGDKYNAFLTVSSIFKRVNEMYTIGRKK
jgi:hypothetical protein